MTPPTDKRFSVTLVTVQLVEAKLDEADLRLPAADFARLQHSNELCREGRLHIHKAVAVYEERDSEAQQGAMQSAMFDIQKGDGRTELRELLDAVKTVAMERMYPVEERRVIG